MSSADSQGSLTMHRLEEFDQGHGSELIGDATFFIGFSRFVLVQFGAAISGTIYSDRLSFRGKRPRSRWCPVKSIRFALTSTVIRASSAASR